MSALVKGSGGGNDLPVLSNPASETEVKAGFDCIDANGSRIEGVGNFLSAISGVFNLTEEGVTMPAIACDVLPSYAILTVHGDELTTNNTTNTNNMRTQKIVIDFVHESAFVLIGASTTTNYTAGTSFGEVGFEDFVADFYTYENGEFVFKTNRKFYANKNYHYVLMFE